LHPEQVREEEESIMGPWNNFVMETAWSALWNVTDETPANCATFLDQGGVELFLEVLEACAWR
jgi:hypothetical protein